MYPLRLEDCRACPRLAAYLADCRQAHPDYHARPVSPFGTESPRLVVVGLAPGYHGANRSGRPFTGDHAGILLYETLHTFGFASRPVSRAADDGLALIGCRITNAVKCCPPANKPETAEIRCCNAWLARELTGLPAGTVLLALGQIAHGATLMALGQRAKDYPFGHGVRHCLTPGLTLYDSYHCSRYNTQTRRLTPAMFRDVFQAIRNQLEETAPCPS